MSEKRPPEYFWLPMASASGECFHAVCCGAHGLKPVRREKAIRRIDNEELRPCGNCIEHHDLENPMTEDDDDPTIEQDSAHDGDDESPLLDLFAQADEMESDETIDFDAESRQAEGWFKLYVECPDCNVPMARTVTESKTPDSDDPHAVSESELRAICPDCREVMTVLEITRRTGPFDELA